MYKIVEKRKLADAIYLFKIEAHWIANSANPGQFLIVRLGRNGERIPLTICDYDKALGTVTIVVQEIGNSSKMICKLDVDDCFNDVVGPLGNKSNFVSFDDNTLKNKKYLFIAGGVGAAPVYPQVKYLYEKGASVDVIVGAKNSSMLILEKELSLVCNNLYICTDDGSKGYKGLVTNMLQKLLDTGEKYDEMVAIGPMIMMKFVTLAAKPYNIPLIVSLNTLMVDGTGMCGACRVTVGGKVRFTCVDGPEFNAYEVDFDEALRRQTIYRSQELSESEKKSLLKEDSNIKCACDK